MPPEPVGIHRPLRRVDLDPDPLEQLRRWIAEGRDVASPQGQPSAESTMVLSTVDACARPSTRVVPLRGIDARGLLVYTSLLSHKGEDLRERPDATSALVVWGHVGRQARVDASAQLLDGTTCDRVFAGRPFASQVAAWMDRSPAVLGDRSELERRRTDVERRFAGQHSVSRPPDWVVFRLVPRIVELWQAGDAGDHDRFRYERRAGRWTTDRLAP